MEGYAVRELVSKGAFGNAYLVTRRRKNKDGEGRGGGEGGAAGRKYILKKVRARSFLADPASLPAASLAGVTRAERAPSLLSRARRWGRVQGCAVRASARSQLCFRPAL